MSLPKKPVIKLCIVCSEKFQLTANNQRKCKKHHEFYERPCKTCGKNFWHKSRARNKRACLYCSSECKRNRPEPTFIEPAKKLKPSIPLATGRPKGSKNEKDKNDACAVCETPLHSKNYTQVYCSEHRYFHKKHCRYCKEAFHSPKAEKQVYCQETCRLNDQKPCQVCGVYFQPLSKGQIYCETHNKGGPDAKYSIHWKAGATAFVGNPKDNPYKAGTIKACEATEKHVDCSGTMMVFANEWTRCIHCAKMLNRQSASISHVRDF